MSKVFISGSMRIKNIAPEVLDRIDNIINSGLEIIVGDADGVDSSIQNHILSRFYRKVTVYSTGVSPRNNLGEWEIQKVSSDAKEGTRKYFTAKDVKMAQDCDYGLMIWDSKSTGTLSNVLELLQRNKNSLVYVNKIKEFKKVSDTQDLKVLISFMSPVAVEKAEKKLSLSKKIEIISNKQQQMF